MARMVGRRGAGRVLIGLFGVFTLTLLVGCSGDDSTTAATVTPSAELCDGLDVVGEDLDRLGEAIKAGDLPAAQDALRDARGRLAALRDTVQGTPNTAAAQSAGDLVGALDGMQTTFRQIGQGGDSIQGVAQELEIQVISIASSFTSLKSELGCK